jgi:hypothetical protein
MTEKDKMKAYVRNWKFAGDQIDRMKGEELRNLTPSESAKRINDVMLMTDCWLAQMGQTDRESGLVEQQMYFKKWRTSSI